MYDDSLLIVEQKLNSLKKLFETYWLDDKKLSYKGNIYHKVFYKKYNTVNGGIIFTPNDENITKEEYLEAFELFVLLITRTNSTKEHGNYKNKASMIGFENTEAHLKALLKRESLIEDEKKLMDILINMLREMINLQDQLSDLMNRFNSFLKSKEPNNIYHPEDVDVLLKMNAELDYIQNQQGNLSIDSVDYFKQLEEVIKNKPSMFTTAVRRYVSEFTKDKEKMIKNLKEVTQIDTSNINGKEDYINAYIIEHVDRQRELNKGLLKDLRYPKGLLEVM
ncbi:hypothetical protein [Piscibacillus salipiscarius]|uniref:hypothetical protein n=1 Tax=Piscibacillus salipiscarius TaxID=299480 RepID=UPI0006D13ECB|nr:hypothetical protein [Piscibacillus salipiscarius]